MKIYFENIQGWNADLLASLIEFILTSELHELTASEPLKSWSIPAEPEPPRASAAHPRAFKGTKKQPPKPEIEFLLAQSMWIDYVLDPESIDD